MAARTQHPKSPWRLEPLVHIAVLTATGLAYRATFITQGFNATDEGWLQSVGRRVVLGQVPYKDFDFVFPRMPLTVLKEAALQAVFGDAYTILFARWVFAVEATLGSIVTYLILRRFASDRAALLVSLPTVFFSVIIYYFSNYTFDANFLALTSVLFLTLATDKRSWPAWVAGALAGLAVLAKPNYGELVVVVPAIAIIGGRLVPSRESIHPALVGVYRHWPGFVTGAAVPPLLALAVFTALGALPALLRWPFTTSVAVPHGEPLTFAIWQDLPSAFAGRELKLFALVAGAIVLAAIVRVPGVVRWLALVGAPVGIAIYTVHYFGAGGGFLPMAAGLLLVLNLMAIALWLLVKVPSLRDTRFASALQASLPPVEIYILGLALQYFAQFTTTGIIYSYIGAYLTLPGALLLVWALAAAVVADLGPVNRWRSWSPLAPALLAIWISVASITYVREFVYFDDARTQLTATFTTPKLEGIWSTPANVKRVDSLVAVIDRYSKPGDPIFVMPDFSCIYYLTDRTNPTRQDWATYIDLAKGEESPVSDLERNRPKVVVIQSVSEFDWARTYQSEYVINYTGSNLAAIYNFLQVNYVEVTRVGDLIVMVPRLVATSALETQPQEQHWPEITPPVDYRTRTGVRLLAPGVGDLDGHLLPPVPAKQRLREQIRFHLVAAQPWLVDLHPGVVQDLQAVGLVATGGVGHSLTNQQREENGEDLDEPQTMPWHVHVAPALEMPGSAHQVQVFIGQWADEISQLRGVVLAVRGHHGNDIEAV